MNEAGNNKDIRAEAVPLREKLKAVRDSDHPASNWARNVIQCMDELKERPDDPDLLRALGKCVAMMEKCMAPFVPTAGPRPLSADEIADIFRLRARMIRDPQ